MSKYPLCWNLDTLNLADHNQLSKIPSLLDAILDENELSKQLLLLQNTSQILKDIEAYSHCLFAQNTKDPNGPLLIDCVKQHVARLEKISTLISEKLKNLSEEAFENLSNLDCMKGLSFFLKEKRILAKNLLPLDKETLITDLSVDGYHGLSNIYQVLHSSLEFKIDDESLSFGQIDNLMHHEDRSKRVIAFEEYKKIFGTHMSSFAQILNHLAGFRLKVYQNRGWEEILEEPLFSNRLTKKSLMTLYNTLNNHKGKFSDYLRKKASLLGLNALSWHDVETPLFAAKKTRNYQQGCAVIIDALEQLSPKVGSFAKKALQEQWIEAEDRKDKGAGGFCVKFSLCKQSRIFMTYSGTDSNLSTLAHELGHAYHNHILFNHPFLSQDVKMNLAECASTMFELIVSDYLFKNAQTKEEKLSILDEKISRSIAFFMNIQARFLFELDFYEQRKDSFVSAEKLCELMLQAQKKAYNHTLDDYNPLFWASKMHFFFTDVPFYNFPYTFGYLFSLCLHALFPKEPSSFISCYDAFLYDSSIMSTEALALKHLGYSLDDPSFWELGITKAISDIELFMELI